MVCPVWPSFDANPKVERGLNRPCPVGQSVLSQAVSSEESHQSTAESPSTRDPSQSVAPDQLTAFSKPATGSVDVLERAACTHGLRGRCRVTRGVAGWQLRAACCRGRPSCRRQPTPSACLAPGHRRDCSLAPCSTEWQSKREGTQMLPGIQLWP